MGKLKDLMIVDYIASQEDLNLRFKVIEFIFETMHEQGLVHKRMVFSTDMPIPWDEDFKKLIEAKFGIDIDSDINVTVEHVAKTVVTGLKAAKRA